ncbi:MAG TPA: large-conductance mechanosensitive channel protein MscL [Phycisphaerales bacterium]|nr:large-conductance mechanosensitive channel protein MscL [Phycisphaerales bacterium]
MGLIKEFKEFALKGNFFDLAVGVIIGAAFGGVVNSMVADMVMPIVSLPGNVDFSDAAVRLKEGADPTVTTDDIYLRWGKFVTVFINFLILAFVLFLVVKAYNTAKRRFEAEKAAAPAPAQPTAQEKLLAEIRDLLARRQ